MGPSGYNFSEEEETPGPEMHLRDAFTKEHILTLDRQ
jgi:hypothetical protein